MPNNVESREELVLLFFMTISLKPTTGGLLGKVRLEIVNHHLSTGVGKPLSEVGGIASETVYPSVGQALFVAPLIPSAISKFSALNVWPLGPMYAIVGRSGRADGAGHVGRCPIGAGRGSARRGKVEQSYLLAQLLIRSVPEVA